MMKYNTIIWDMDGTLLDTLRDLSDAVNHTLRLYGLPLREKEEVRRLLGNGVRNLMRGAVPGGEKNPRFDDILADFKAYYTAHIDVHTRPYPGIQELLRQLHQKGVQMAVASNKFQEGTDYLINKFFPEIPFVAVLGNRPGFPLKPHPEIVEEVLHRAKVTRTEAIMTGDSPTDMKTAANGGIDRIAVSWGYRPMKGIPGLRVAESAEQILDLFSLITS